MSTFAAVTLPAHLVSSPWTTIKTEYFDLLDLDTPSLDSDSDASESEEDGEVLPYKAFPVTPPPQQQTDAPAPAPFKLSLPARRSSSTPAPSSSRLPLCHRTVAPLTPPTSPVLSRPSSLVRSSAGSTAAPPPRTKEEVHQDTPRPVSPHRERSWDAYFARPVKLDLQSDKQLLEGEERTSSEWHVESVQLWYVLPSQVC